MINTQNMKIRREAISHFQGTNEDGNKPLSIFMTTTTMGGVGLTLHASHKAFLLDPCWLQSSETQGFSRIFRIGQRQPITYAYRFTCPEEWIEKEIIRRQTSRKNMHELVFNITADTSDDDPTGIPEIGSKKRKDEAGKRAEQDAKKTRLE